MIVHTNKLVYKLVENTVSPFLTINSELSPSHQTELDGTIIVVKVESGHNLVLIPTFQPNYKLGFKERV